MIRINASLIKDYISCPKRAWYRMHVDEYDIPQQDFPYLTVGTIVHQAIEMFHNNADKAKDFVEINSAIASLPDSYSSKAISMITNFFKIKDELGLDLSSAIFEKSFEYEDKKHGVIFTGRFDCITRDNSVYDWKTSSSLPKDVNLDPQFIIYDRAIEQITGSKHNLYYVYLKLKRVIKYERDTNVSNLFFDEIIGSFKRSLSTGIFERRGLFDYNDTCRSCQFKDICFKESSIYKLREDPKKLSLF